MRVNSLSPDFIVLIAVDVEWDLELKERLALDSFV